MVHVFEEGEINSPRLSVSCISAANRFKSQESYILGTRLAASC
jgi:hypothetical protein